MGDTENDKKIEPTEDDKEEELEKKPSRYVSLQPQKVMAYWWTHCFPKSGWILDGIADN